MKRETIFGAIVTILLVLQAQAVFAADGAYQFFSEIKAGNLSKAERILKNNVRRWNATEQEEAWNFILDKDVSSARSLDAVRLLQQYNVNWGTTNVSLPLLFEKSEELIRHLISIGMPLGSNAVFFAIDGGYGDNLIQFLFEKGAETDGQDLRKAAEKKRWVLVPLIVNRLGEDDMSYRDTRAEALERYNSRSADYRNRVSFDYDTNSSKTALMFAAEYGQRNMVRLLVEKGTRVNLRADGGETAASLAYDNGEIEIYNYLKQNGAIDYEPLTTPRQVAQQPSAPAQSTTNVYVQPSAPAQAAPAQNTPSTPTLRTGRYACSGTNVTMELLPTTRFVTLYSGYTTVGNGQYNINGNTITITIIQASGVASSMQGKTYAYTIMSDTSFSGSGETWYRR